MCRLLSLSLLLLLTEIIINTERSYAHNNDTYTINNSHSSVRFIIDKGIGKKLTGGVYNLTGQLSYSAPEKKGYIKIDIPIKNIQTFKPLFTKTLKRSSFFNVATYPTAKFESTKWHFAGNLDAKGNRKVTKIDGLLTMLGVTKPVTLRTISFNCISKETVNTLCNGNFTSTIDRTKWGMDKYSFIGVSKKVTLNIRVKALRDS